jgi:hypothetical protein
MRPHGRARVNPSRPEAWGSCDRCGFNFNLVDLRPQFQWAGFTMIDKRIRVCVRCHDVPSEHLRTIVLPPDPRPVHDPRPEPYSLDETDYRITEDGDRRVTEESDPRIVDDGT